MPRTAIGLLIVALAAPALAEVVTDGTVGPRVRLSGDLAIGAELGRTAGHNLFHSFERFSLATGERATFSGPDGIHRIISRVTGGARSDIDGTLRSTIPGADLFFLNPAGVVFGPNASLDLQGSFYVSTADELRFADGTKFSATNPAASSFAVASPEAFGFLGAHDPAAILVDRSTLAVPPGEALSLVGGGVTITAANNGAFGGGTAGRVLAEAGTITLAATAGAASLDIASGELSTNRGADITLRDQALVGTSGNGGGTIYIRGGDFVVKDESFVFAGNVGASDAVGGIDVDADRVQVTNGSALRTDALGSGRGGDLRVDAAEVRLSDGGLVATIARDRGDAGSVRLVAGSLDMLAGGQIGSATFAAGNAGQVTVRADRLLIRRGTSEPPTGISSTAGAGAGNAGAVRVAVGGQVIVDGGSISSDVGSGSSGQGGTVQIAAGELEILRDGQIRSLTFSDGNAGRVIVEAERLRIRRGGPGVVTGILSDAEDGSGSAGGVQVVADDLEIRTGGAVSSSTFAAGNAGPVTVQAGRLLIRRDDAAAFTGVTSSVAATSSGDAGPVEVVAGKLEVLDGGEIGSSTFGVGNAGTVRVVAGELDILAGGIVASDTFAAGKAGSVTVQADRLLIGHRDSVHVTGIRSSAERGSSRDAGTVRIVAGELEIREGGEIGTSTFGKGNAGRITIEADHLLIQRGSSQFFTGVVSSAETGSSGDAGIVQIAAGELKILAGGAISSATLSIGDAGSITVDADRLLIRGDASQFFTGILSAAATSLDGDVGQGNAGRVRIQAKTVEITDGGNIGSFADGPGTAGDVILRAADRLILDGASIDTKTTAAGGGEIQLLVGDIIDLRDSDVITSVAGGADPTAGNILIDPRFLIIDGSRIQANAPAGFGGRVRIVADNVLVPGGDFDALLARGDISASGGDPTRAGTVVVSAPEVDLSGGLVVVEGGFVDTTELGERCAARRDIGASSFTGVGRGGLPPSPDGPLSSALAGGDAPIRAGPASAAPSASGNRVAGWAPPCRPWN